MPRALAIAILTLFMSSAGASTGAAPDFCSCTRPRAMPCAAYWNADRVFVGRVESIRRTGSQRQVVFAVSEGIRGVRSSTVDVVTPAAGGPCSISFRTGGEYIVYAASDAATATLRVDACSRTRPLDDAGGDLEYVRSVRDRAAPAGTISGRVVIERRDLSGRVLSEAGVLSGARVRIAKDGPENTAEVVETDVAGSFAAANRGPGVYSVSLDVPPAYYADVFQRVVRMDDVRACGEVTLAIAANGRVAGRVVDSGGKPVVGLTVQLATANGGQRQRTVTDRTGAYAFSRLPAGRFAIRAGTRSPILRVAVGAGQSHEAGDLMLPPSARYVPITGFVLTSDGQPAEGARVFLKGADRESRIETEPAVADFLGRFTIAAAENAEHRLFAELTRARRVEASDEQVVLAAPGQPPLQLVVRRRY